MKGGELSLSKYLMAELASALHDRTEHLIVATSYEQYFPGVELEEGTSD